MQFVCNDLFYRQRYWHAEKAQTVTAVAFSIRAANTRAGELISSLPLLLITVTDAVFDLHYADKWLGVIPACRT